MNMDFSVLMSVYYKESAEALRQSLDSIFAQTLLPTEIILVEDGPLGDELENVVKEYELCSQLLRVLRLKQNVGLGKALNEGLALCRYDYVARMDSDDICYPQRFEIQIAYLKKHPEIDVIGSWTQEFMECNGVKHYLSIKKFPHTIGENEKYARKRCPVEHSAVILRKQAVIDSGGYKHFYLFEDYYLWARMFINGAKFYNIQKPLLFFRVTFDSFKRRGGLKYAISELKGLCEFKRIGFFTTWQFCIAVIIRFPIRLLPNNLRKMFYHYFLRGR